MGRSDFRREVDLTDDVGASVVVYGWSEDKVHLHAGGDLSISLGFHHERAREFGLALIEAADQLAALATPANRKEPQSP